MNKLPENLRHSISFLLIIALITSFFFWPGISQPLSIFILLVIFTMSVTFGARRHWQAYKQGRITRFAFVRNTSLDIFGILLAVALAGLLGRYIAEIVTEQVGDELMKLLAGIMVGMLVGIGVGILVCNLWERFVRISPDN